ncbi:MAG: alkene reductase, partial [Gammaproteobacteria bacterium]|nr:alkene reductase [Gammaproteobacteria bacterium]
VCFALDAEGNPAGGLATSKPVAMEQADIERVRAEFVNAAVNALDAGMDGVEIHGANGYLFDQFLNSQVNTRKDAYGGSVENRCRFLLEVVDAVAAAVGLQRVGVRISPNGRFNAMPADPELEGCFLYLAGELNRRGIAYLHINDQATFGMPAIPDGLIPLLRAQFKGCLILCGGYDADRAKQALDEGLADLVAFGVPFIANPDLPARLENGWPLNPPDQATFYGGDAKGYTDYPRYTAAGQG